MYAYPMDSNVFQLTSVSVLVFLRSFAARTSLRENFVNTFRLGIEQDRRSVKRRRGGFSFNLDFLYAIVPGQICVKLVGVKIRKK